MRTHNEDMPMLIYRYEDQFVHNAVYEYLHE